MSWGGTIWATRRSILGDRHPGEECVQRREPHIVAFLQVDTTNEDARMKALRAIGSQSSEKPIQSLLDGVHRVSESARLL